MIRFEQVRKRFPGATQEALCGLDLDVAAGELLVLLGESGCGKTTTLKLINRLVEPTSGRIAVDGRNVSDHDPITLRRSIGYVFQGIGLFPHLTVTGNIGVVPELLGWPATKVASRVDELLEMVHLDPAEFAGRLPRDLSGGQRQRVGVARALAARPRLLLMDEPFGALDPLTRASLQDELRALHERLELTTVLVTHDMTEALLLADRVAVLRSGRLLATGTPHTLLASPPDPYVQRLMDTPRRQADRVETLVRGGSSPS
ncbi:MAG: ABC transporter ATP-binding protein [Acidobacteriota bacterium]